MKGLIRSSGLCLALAISTTLHAENLTSIENSLASKIATSSQALPEAKERLVRFSRAGQVQRFGITFADEAESLEFVSPLPVYSIPYADLRNFTPDRDPAEIMVDAHEVLYLTVNKKVGRVASAVIIRETAGGWKPVMFGFARTAATIAGAQRRASSLAANPARFLVRIRALNISFLAYRRGTELMLIAVGSIPGIQANESTAAREVFKRMAERSRNLNLEGVS